MSMPRVTLLFAAILIALGLVAYVGSGMESWTALIPSIFGGVFGILGGVALLGEGPRKHAMHVAAAFALLAILGTARGVPDVIALVGGSEVERPVAAVVQVVMLLLSGGYLGLCVNSFIQARKKKQAEEAAA